MKFPSVKNILITIILFGLTYLLGYQVTQHEFWKIITLYIAFFLGYIHIASQCTAPDSQSLKFWIIVAILCRLILLFSLPNLSNDVYRFIWDGRLLVNGYNPFDHLPLYYLENNINVPGINMALFEAFDSKNFYTVYPPVAQAQFGSAVWLFPESVVGASIVMKLWLLVFEIGSILLIINLLEKFNLPKRNVLWYALNPLIIFEITGNLHFEGAMIFFLLLAVWLLIKCKTPAVSCLFFSAIAFALSICSKLLTILFLPFFIKILGWKKAVAYCLLTGLFTVLFFVPIINETFLINFGESLNLYFQKLEFNASLYYVMRWIGFQFSGYNQIAFIGPLLGLVAMLGVLWMAFRGVFIYSEESKISEKRMIEYWLFSICLYLFCTTTMHPWYVAMPVALCVFTKWRFPIIWSGLIFLTYINYSYEPYFENLWVVALEYTIVFGWLIWEWKERRFEEIPNLN